MKNAISKNHRLVFFVTVSFFWFSLYAYVPFVTPFADYMGANLRLAGLIAGAYGFTQMVVRFPLGLLSDKLQRRKIFVQLGLLVAAIGAFLAFIFPSPYMLLVMRGLGGVAASAWVTFIVLGASYYGKDEAPKAMGSMSSANAFGRMIALLLGGIIAQRLGVTYAFLLGGVAGIIGLVFSFFIKENRPKNNQRNFGIACPTEEGSPGIAEVNSKNSKGGSLKDVIKNKQLIFCSILGILAMFISFATTFGFTPLAASLLDASQFQLAMLGVMSTAPAIFISPLAGTIMPKRLGVGTTLAIGFVVAGAGSALVAVSSTLPALFVVQIAGSIGGAIVGTLLMGLCIRDISAEKRGTAMGFYQAVYGLGMFLGPFVTGHISHHAGLMTAFVFTGAVGAFGAMLAIVFAWKKVIRF